MNNSNFFFFLEIHYLNTELYNFIKNQVQLECGLNITKQTKHPIINGNLLVVSGMIENELQFKQKTNQLIHLFNNYNSFLTIISLSYNNYWFSLNSYYKIIESINQSNKLNSLLFIKQIENSNLLFTNNLILNFLIQINAISQKQHEQH